MVGVVAFTRIRLWQSLLTVNKGFGVPQSSRGSRAVNHAQLLVHTTPPETATMQLNR